MNDKEYTYDIDKYTIGVEQDGEDGIGMTIAIIKNGEINFLGNCYGENARCIDLLIKENQQLKEDLKTLWIALWNNDTEMTSYQSEIFDKYYDEFHKKEVEE